jgi:hypothetical protein
VERTHGGEGLQDHEIECALQEVEFAGGDQMNSLFPVALTHEDSAKPVGMPQEGSEM